MTGTGSLEIREATAGDRCRDAGCYKMALSSNMKRDRAHAFYDRLGFDRHGYSFQVDLRSERVEIA